MKRILLILLFFAIKPACCMQETVSIEKGYEKGKIRGIANAHALQITEELLDEVDQLEEEPFSEESDNELIE